MKAVTSLLLFGLLAAMVAFHEIPFVATSLMLPLSLSPSSRMMRQQILYQSLQVPSRFHTSTNAHQQDLFIQLKKEDKVRDSMTDPRVEYPKRCRLFFFHEFCRAVIAFATSLNTSPVLNVAHAAPPISIIAEELGYFPVSNSKGSTVYVAKRIQRESTAQALELANFVRQQKIVLAGTYWCPHTSRQKELLGRVAFANIPYVECSSNGYGGNPKYCTEQQIDGYPTWVFPDGRKLSGEQPLKVIARESGYQGDFRDEMETNLPPMIGISACSVRSK